MFAEAHSRPPWASMIERQIESPMPMPPDLVVKKALNSRSAFSAEIPTPQSVTLTSTCCVSSWSDRITSSRGRTVTECMASMPFIHSLMADQLTLHQRDGLPHDVIDVERHLLKAGLVRERPDAPDHLTRPIAVVDNPFHRAARGVQVGSLAVEPPQTGLAVGDDGGERLVHFMRDRGRQFAQGCYAHDMRQVRLRVAQRLFGVNCADRRSNIGAGAPIAEKIAVCVIKWLAACLDVYRRSSPVDGVHEIAKWPMRVEHRPMLSPFFGFPFDIGCNIPA